MYNNIVNHIVIILLYNTANSKSAISWFVTSNCAHVKIANQIIGIWEPYTYVYHEVA